MCMWWFAAQHGVALASPSDYVEPGLDVVPSLGHERVGPKKA